MLSKSFPMKPMSRTLSGTLPCGVPTFLPQRLFAENPAATAQLPYWFYSTRISISEPDRRRRYGSYPGCVALYARNALRSSSLCSSATACITSFCFTM